MREITPADIEALLNTEKYSNLNQALSNSNWYTWTELLEDLTEFINELKAVP